MINKLRKVKLLIGKASEVRARERESAGDRVFER